MSASYRAFGYAARLALAFLAPTFAVSAAEPIRIGEISPLTGKEAAFGQQAHRGVVMALEEINAQVAELAADFVRTGELDPPQFPRYFRTIINEGVASSLDLRVTDSARNFARRAPAPQ